MHEAGDRGGPALHSFEDGPDQWPQSAVRYVRLSDAYWATEVLDRIYRHHENQRFSGDRLSVSVECPRCGHGLNDSLRIDPELQEALRGENYKLVRELAPVRSHLHRQHRPLCVYDVVACKCGEPHDMQPEEKRGRAGCGYYAGVALEALPEGARETDLVPIHVARSVSADPDAVRDALAAKLSGVQSHADKQSGYLSGVIGLLSAALILQTTDHILDKPLGIRILIFMFFIAGLLCAAGAAVLIALAARGTESPRLMSDGQLRLFYQREIARAVHRLNVAIPLAVSALVALAVSVGLLWLYGD